VIVGASGGLGGINNNSMASSNQLTQANQGGSSVIVFTGLPGLWEIVWQCFYTSNFVSTVTNSIFNIQMGAGAIVIPIAIYMPAGATQQQVNSDSGVFTIALQAQWNLVINVGGNAVGQTHTLSAAAIANKLI
jgi:hypothetical protein